MATGAFAAPSPAAVASLGAARSLLLVANGNASGVGSGTQAARLAANLLAHAGARVETTVTATADELAAAVMADPERRVALLGGDGSLHALANLPGDKPEIALLPAGRANNVARSLGIPLELRAAARLAAEGRARPFDTIAATSRDRSYRAVEGVSVGFLARARTRYRAANSASVGEGVRAGLAELTRFRPIEVGLSSAGPAATVRVAQLFVANTPLYAFGLRVSPSADPSDALLDLVAIGGSRRASVLPMLFRLRRGKHIGRADVHTAMVERVRIDPAGESPVVCDSVSLGSGPVDLTVEPGALRVVSPAR